MKQVLQNMRDGKTSVTEVPTPMPRPGQALVKVAASLVSAGTERMLVEFSEKSLVGKARSRPDLARQVIDRMKREGMVPAIKAAFSRLDQPMALGYSSAGTIVSLGDGMEGFKVGQRVACSGGGYAVHAEYNVVPRLLLTPLPDEVDFESAAFTTLGAIAMHGFRLSEAQIGENVAIIGMGLLGLLAGQIAAAAGCHVMGIEPNPVRIALAASLGLSACSREQAVESAQAFTTSHGFDVVLICADTLSNDPVELAALIARDRARIVATGAVGLTLPRKTYYEKELSFINSRSYGPGRYDVSFEEKGNDYPSGYVRWTEGRNFQAVVDLMASGKLKVIELISHQFPIENAVEAYELITGKKRQPFLGVLLTYPHDLSGAPVNRVVFPVHLASGTGKHDTIKLGVLGAGLFANATLLPALKKIGGIELVGIASAGGQHAQHAAKKFGFGYAASNDDEILNDQNINTVAILTRHDLHAGLVVKALQAGKHVFVEKPLAINMGGLNTVIAAMTVERDSQSESPRLLTVGFNRRFAPLASELSKFLSNRPEPFHAHYRVNAGYIPANHWVHDHAQGGGRVIGEGCHFVDFLTFLAGAAPISANAQSLPDSGKYHEDIVSMTLTFPDGSVGVVDYLANGDKSFPKERVEIFCGGSVAVLDDFRTLEMIRDGRRTEMKKSQDKGWHNEWVAFLIAIREKREPPIPYDQLVDVTKATFAVMESIHQGGAQIKIDGHDMQALNNLG